MMQDDKHINARHHMPFLLESPDGSVDIIAPVSPLPEMHERVKAKATDTA